MLQMPGDAVSRKPEDQPMKRLLEGKAAVVTGAGAGIGRATALRFAQEGARVVFGDVNDVEAEETLRLIGLAGGEGRFLHCDVRRGADVDRHGGDREGVGAAADGEVDGHARGRDGDVAHAIEGLGKLDGDRHGFAAAGDEAIPGRAVDLGDGLVVFVVAADRQ